MRENGLHHKERLSWTDDILENLKLLVFWNGNDAEIIWADEEPLIVKVHAQEAFLYQENVGPAIDQYPRHRNSLFMYLSII